MFLVRVKQSFSCMWRIKAKSWLHFSFLGGRIGRAVRYLINLFIKNNRLKDWLRVLTSDRQSLQLRYFNVRTDDAEDEDSSPGAAA